MKRGEIVILNFGNNIGKPRPGLVMQADILNDDARLETTIIIPLSTTLSMMDVMRYTIEPNKSNGLAQISQVMIEKIMQVEKSKVQQIVGHIVKKQMNEIEARLLAILGIK